MDGIDQRIDAYIAKAAPFAKPILVHLRKLIHEACPEVVETLKWSSPCFLYKGGILCGITAFKKHCSFGFWKAAIMQDTDGIPMPTERNAMGPFSKIESLIDLPDDEILKKYIKAAMKLNEDEVKLPPRPKPTETQKQELVVPDYFITTLAQDEKAKEIFYNFSYSHKKEYLEWITDAKTDTTRNKRMAQAIAWIKEGKGRNWKYEKC